MTSAHCVFRRQNHRCFLVDIPAKTTIRAEYESPDTTDTLVRLLVMAKLHVKVALGSC